MELSFEILEAKRGARKVLFSKLDCSPAELAFLQENQLLRTEIYTHNYEALTRMKMLRHISAGFLKAITLGSESEAKKNDKFLETLPLETITIAKLITGHTLLVYAHEVAQIEQVIEARVIAFGENLRITHARELQPARTRSV